MDSESPSCTCPDFALTFWPCKHFFAIWNADKGYAWNSLPAWYMNSPFLSIDNHVIFRSKQEVAAVSESVSPIPSVSPQPSDSSSVTNENSDCEVEVLPQIPLKTYPKRTTVSKCVEYLSTLKNMVYDVTDEEDLNNFQAVLQEQLDRLKAGCDIDSGLTVLNSSKQTTKKKPIQKLATTKLLNIPSALKRKNNFSGRVGKRANLMKTNFQVNVPVDLKIHRKRKTDNASSKRVCDCAGSHEMPLTPAMPSMPSVSLETPVSSKPSVSPNEFVSSEPSMFSKLSVPFKSKPSEPSKQSESQVFAKPTVFSKPNMSAKPSVPAVHSLNKTVVKIAPHSITSLQLHSLCSELPKGKLLALKAMDPVFREGWLYDEILNAYFNCLCRENQNLLYISSCSMLIIEKGSSIGSLFTEEKENLAGETLIIAPWNSSGGHWVMVCLGIVNRVVIYMDPSQKIVDGTTGVNSVKAIIALRMMARVAKEKFGIQSVALSCPPHSTQSDGSSCGVYVCWFAHQLGLQWSVTQHLDQRQFRGLILEKIRKYNVL
ncbi:uncharacterized protein LOC135491247 [Lineus longissimus]|uniref:uncharacterized protein LOC135491247 n=1 Tax=Lineus longissimus TaxID=88925 RepID=UPI00315DB2A3